MTVADICAEASKRTGTDIQWSYDLDTFVLHVDDPASGDTPLEDGRPGAHLTEGATLDDVLRAFAWTFGEA